MGWDVKILYLFNGLVAKSPVFDSVVIFFGSYFQYLLGLLFLAGLYFGHISRSEKQKIFLVAITASIVARLGITELIRFLYHRPRPFLIYNDIHALLSDNEYSFPSGHAAFFFAFAMAIYLYNKRWGVWFFIAAILISVSRVMAGVHYPSDIMGGAIIGITSGYLIFNYAGAFFEKRAQASNPNV